MSNIWILNHYADSPDRPSTRSYDLARRLVEWGHQVTIFASGYSHYTLREEKLSDNEKSKEEVFDGVRFLWLKTTPYHRNGLRRFVNIVSYSWRAFWLGKGMEQRPDVIIGVTVHPLAGLTAYLLSRFKGSRFFFEVTDLWPEELVEMGFLSPRHPVTWVLATLERFLYRKAEKIIMLWPHANRHTTALGIPEAKVFWIPHCVDLSRYTDLDGYDGGTSPTFTVMYLGSHISEYGLDVILDAAHLLKDRSPEVKFVFVGGGTEKPRLVKRADGLGLDNVEFRDPVPKNRIGQVMVEADAFVFSRLNLDAFLKYGISNNKLCDYLASRRPVIFCCSASNDPVADAGAGISAPAGDSAALARAIEQLVAMCPAERQKMGQRGLKYVKEHHEVGVLAKRLEGLL